jgi:hypothetical protein
VPFIGWPENRMKSIEVALPGPVKPGQKCTMILDYAGPLSGNLEAARYVHDHISREFTILRLDCYAYPILGVPNDQKMMAKGFTPTFSYNINVTVPTAMVVSVPGKLDSKQNRGSKSIYSYSNVKLTFRMDICIADYSILEDRDLNLKIFYFPVDSSGASSIADHYIGATNYYTSLYGRISEPEHFTIIEVPSEYGSQSDVSGVLLQQINFEPNSNVLGLYHELSHQWDPTELGGLHVRWSEGLADFHQYFLQQELDGKEDAVEAGFENARGRFISSMKDHPEYMEVPFSEYGLQGLSDLSYLKGMMFNTILYGYLGEDQFFNMMRAYYQKYYIQGASLEDYVAHIELFSDRGAGQLIKEWIYSAKSNRYILEGISPENMVARYKLAKPLLTK